MTREEASFILRKFYADGFKSNNYNALEQALQLAVMCLENLPHWISVEFPHWISVEDELPMEYEPVLAAFGNHYARVCFYSGGKWYIDAGVISDEVFGVSHWIQIPPPPKKGGEE